MSAKPLKKLYYSISEVSEMTGLKQYVLRYWETEFPELKPQKNRAGNRVYREKDVKLIKEIMKLLYEQKFTIEGARQKLKDDNNNKKSAVKKSSNVAVNIFTFAVRFETRNPFNSFLTSLVGPLSKNDEEYSLKSTIMTFISTRNSSYRSIIRVFKVSIVS